MADEESIARPRETRLWATPPLREYSLALHGGAGGRIEELSTERRESFEAGLRRAYLAGRVVLEDGGSALDAVCATVEQLEDDPLFNAGRGAALAADGSVEHDAAVMDDDGRAGAIAVSRYAKNPVRLARAVLENSSHVLLVDPARDLATGWDLEVREQDYFVTEARKVQLERIHALRLAAPRHGTVGAVARDRDGRIAVATSTGGMAAQSTGRVGDSPVIGAGTYARGDSLAVSCTGEGEAFIRGVVSYDIAARMRYLGAPLADAVRDTVLAELTAKDASGGLVAVAPDGTVVVAHNSPTMFAAFEGQDGVVLLT